MTSLQIASMMARRSPWKTLSQLPMEDANALCAAVNQALQLWFEKASASHTSVLGSVALHGPALCRAHVSKGSNRVQFLDPKPAWLGEAIGCSLRLEGDAKWNRLMAAEGLLHAYEGETGTVEVTLYHDCAPLGSETVNVCSHVRYARAGGEMDLPNREIPAFWLREGNTHRVGTPDRYCIEPLNPGANSQPFFVLRVWPMPASDARLSYRVAKHFNLTTADLQRATALPVPEDVASGIIFPIALDRAAGLGLLAKDTDLQRIAADAAAAVERIGSRTMLPTTEMQWMGTSYGF